MKIFSNCLSRSSFGRQCPGREQEAVEKVFTLRPIAKPNRRMVMLADKILGREGRLIDAMTWKKADLPVQKENG